MRHQRIAREVVDTGQHPEDCKSDRRDREPAPQSRPRKRERRGGHDREIDIERPVIRRFARYQHRRDVRADQSETREHRAVQQRRGKRCERNRAKRDEGGCRRKKSVERVSRVHGRECDRRSGRGEHARNMGGRNARDIGLVFFPPHPFTGGNQCHREQRAEENAQAGTDQSRFDRIAHEEDAAEGECKSADPHDPARAELFFETGPARWLRRYLRTRDARRRRGWCCRRSGGFNCRWRCRRTERRGLLADARSRSRGSGRARRTWRHDERRRRFYAELLLDLAQAKIDVAKLSALRERFEEGDDCHHRQRKNQEPQQRPFHRTSPSIQRAAMLSQWTYEAKPPHPLVKAWQKWNCEL